jgi:hypothetical protein
MDTRTNLSQMANVDDISSFPKLGVKMAHFEEFIEQCGGIECFKDLTTRDVSKKFVRPMTLESKESYCGMLQSKGHSAVATASVFVSHAWKYLFLDVKKALEHHFQDQSDVVVWFDLFSNNQHSTGTRPFEWWCGTFKSAIAEFGHLVMVLAPWSNPVPLKRAWCLFELYCIADLPGGKFEVAMSGAEQANFLIDISTDTEVQLGKMKAIIDCEKSESNKPEDREAIFAAVKLEVGFGKINKMIFERLREWMVHVNETVISKLQKGDDRSSLITAFSIITSN